MTLVVGMLDNSMLFAWLISRVEACPLENVWNLSELFALILAFKNSKHHGKLKVLHCCQTLKSKSKSNNKFKILNYVCFIKPCYCF